MPILSGCGFHDNDSVQTITYPPTDKVEAVFQKSRVPASCRVFANLYATMPAGSSGQQFVEAVSDEARSKGADIILVGQSRQCTTESELNFTYYGSNREYKIRDWPGWSYGFEEWQEQGDWTGIGYKEWGSNDIHYDYPILLQVAFVRCQ
jgi:hypothetical protein